MPIDSTPAQDQLSPEDSAALVHAQQQLYAAGDPRAEKLYNYIVKAGYATAGQQGELHPIGETKSFYDKYLKGTLSGNAGWQQEIDKAAQTEPVTGARSVANDLGAGMVRSTLSIAAHPLQTASGIAELGAAAMGSSAARQDLINKTAETIARNPSGEAVAAIPQAALAIAGAGEAKPVANAIELSGEGGGAIPAAAARTQATVSKFLPSLVDGPPESLMTRAIKPGKNNVGWNADVQKAIPLMKTAEQQLGRPIAGVDDALEAAQIAKKDIWQKYQSRLGPNAQAAFDGNQIADAMMRSIDRRTAIQNPGLVQKVQAIADTYRKPITLTDAEDFLQSANKDLNAYYAKNKVGQNVALNDPEIASTVAEAEALRNGLYSKLDQMTGPGSAQLKKAYGSLTNVEKELYGRQLVAARQNPESLSEQLSTVRGAGKIVKGVFTASPGDVLEGAQNIAVSRALKARNSSDAMIQRAFEAAKPATPFPMPAVRMPMTTNLLPAEAGGKIPLLAPDPGMTAGERIAALRQEMLRGNQLQLPAEAGRGAPLNLPVSEMTPGERTAALMQELRRKSQLRLPARANPLQLPSQFR